MPGSPKPEDNDTLSGGASEADAARPVGFDKADRAKGGAGGPPDAAEAAGTKRRSGEDDPEQKSEPGTTAPADVTTETDDGAA